MEDSLLGHRVAGLCRRDACPKARDSGCHAGPTREEAAPGDADRGDSSDRGWGVGKCREEAGGPLPILDPLMAGRPISAPGKGPKGRSVGPTSKEGRREVANGVRCYLQSVKGSGEGRLGCNNRGAGGNDVFGLLVQAMCKFSEAGFEARPPRK